MNSQSSPIKTREITDSPFTTETSSSDTEYKRFKEIFQKAFLPEEESKAGELFDYLYQKDELLEFIIDNDLSFGDADAAMNDFSMKVEATPHIGINTYQTSPKKEKNNSIRKKVGRWLEKNVPFARSIKETCTGWTVYDDKRMNKAIQNHHKRKTLKIG